MHKLDEIALSQAELAYERWSDLGIAPETISINVPLMRVAVPEFLARVERTTLPKGTLILEILETSFMDEVDAGVWQGLSALRAHGVRIEIDDFGTGHSSILGLIRLMPSCAKIDRQFVPPANAPIGQYRLIKSMIAIAKSLNMKVTVEGVENVDQIDKLRRLGCDIVQGFALSKPLPADQLESLLSGAVTCGAGLRRRSSS